MIRRRNFQLSEELPYYRNTPILNSTSLTTTTTSDYDNEDEYGPRSRPLTPECALEAKPCSPVGSETNNNLHSPASFRSLEPWPTSSSARLYGRDQHAQQLQQAYHRCCGMGVLLPNNRETISLLPHSTSSSPTTTTGAVSSSALAPTTSHATPKEWVLITGPSGTGKTALAETLRGLVEQPETQGYFIRAKFDQLRTACGGGGGGVAASFSSPGGSDGYDALGQALADLVAQVGSSEEPAAPPRRIAVQKFADEDEDISHSQTEHGDDIDDRPAAGSLLQVKATSQATLPAKPKRNRRDHLTWAVEETASRLGRSFLDIIPALRELLEESQSHLSEDAELPGDFVEEKFISTFAMGMGTQQRRLIMCFCRFMQELCSDQHPVVLFLDDLQWADPATLDIVSALLTDTDIPGLMILGACRGNEVALGHHLAVRIRELESNHVRITEIQVSNLDLAAINEMVSDFLQLPLEQTQHLARFVFSQTDGNIFFARHFLVSLSERGFLHRDGDPSLSDDQKKFDDKLFLEEDDKLIVQFDFQDAFRMISNKMRMLPADEQYILKLAACLGAKFDQEMLDLVARMSTEPLLVRVQERGMFLGTARGKWSFSHDQIQACAYSLIGDDERPAMHLRIGRTLWQELSAKKLTENTFLVISQLQRGFVLLDDQDEKDALASFCLKAAEQAAASSSFLTAALFLKIGIAMLGRRYWRDQYHLSLALFNAAVEVEYCNGNMERMDSLISEILRHARSTDDKVQCQCVAIYALGSRNRIQEAIGLGIEVLRNLGEDLPPFPGRWRLRSELSRTRALLRKLSDENILSLPLLSDPKKLAVTRIFGFMFGYALDGRPLLGNLIALRGVQIAIRDGLSAVSCSSFAATSMYLVTQVGDVELGLRCGHIAHKLVDHFQAKEWMARVYCGTYGHAFKMEYSFRDMLKPLLTAHRVALTCGDIEYSLFAAVVYARTAVFVDTRLPELIDSIDSFLGLMRLYHQTSNIQFLRPTYQFALNMTARSANPLILGESLAEEEMALKQAMDNRKHSIVAYLLTFKLILAYHFEDYVTAQKISADLEDCTSKSHSPFSLSYLYLFQALALLSGSRDKSKRQMDLAKSKLKLLKRIATKRPESFMNKVYLLEAEIAVREGQLNLAILMYEKAAVYARNESIFGEIGLAFERAAMAFHAAGRDADAQVYWQNAISSYADWGATAKVQMLQKYVS